MTWLISGGDEEKCLNNDAIETFLVNLNIPKLTD